MHGLANEWATASLGRILKKFSLARVFGIYNPGTLLWSPDFVFPLVFCYHESFSVSTTKGVVMLYWSYKIIVSWEKDNTEQKKKNRELI